MSKKKGRGLMRGEHNGGWGDDYANYYGNHHSTAHQDTRKSYTPKKGWDTGDAPKVCTNCDFTPADKKQKIFINYDTWKSLMAICTKVKLEWQALLTGTIDEQGVVHVTGYWIPKQEVSTASVKNLELVDDVVIAERHIVAGVHSHGNMQCFFSSTDHEDTNMSLIKHHIVVNNQSMYKAQSRVELPCGMVKFIEAEVFTVGEVPAVIEGIENIAERTYGFVTKHETAPTKTYDKRDGEIEGMRWCPICDMSPEEDGGVSCVCWTKSKRHMLPDFTTENYIHLHGRTYELKPELENKYIDMIDPRC